MLLNIALAVMLRGERPAFAFAVAGCLCMAATLAVFFAFTYPGNVAMNNWTAAAHQICQNEIEQHGWKQHE